MTSCDQIPDPIAEGSSGEGSSNTSWIGSTKVSCDTLWRICVALSYPAKETRLDCLVDWTSASLGMTLPNSLAGGRPS